MGTCLPLPWFQDPCHLVIAGWCHSRSLTARILRREREHPVFVGSLGASSFVRLSHPPTACTARLLSGSCSLSGVLLLSSSRLSFLPWHPFPFLLKESGPQQGAVQFCTSCHQGAHFIKSCWEQVLIFFLHIAQCHRHGIKRTSKSTTATQRCLFILRGRVERKK